MNRNKTYTVRKILCGENATEALIVIDNQDAVCPLCGTELTGLGHGDAFWDSQRRARLERGDGALLNIGLLSALAAAALLVGRRNGALARELGLNLLADRLRGIVWVNNAHST